MGRMRNTSILLATTAILFAATGAAAQQPAPVPSAQQPPAADEYDELDEEEAGTIVVTGQRQRGTVIGDIPPENVLDSRDIQATGATSINELIEALAPQLGSARGRGGGRPVLLLNGQRISGFRELRDIPTEAIERAEILPEEVALKYGYRADQRVMNIVLRRRFRSTATRVEAEAPTEGGYVGGEADATRLLIGDNGRTTFNVHAEGNSMLTEDERDIDLADEPADGAVDPREARSLTGSSRQLRAGATVNRTVLGDVGATFNGELEHNDGRSLIGLDELALEPLARRTSSDSAHAGMALNWDKAGWRWSSTANADLSRNRTETDRSGESEQQRSTSTTASADADVTANGTLFALPAGEVGTTVKVGASTLHLDSRRRDADDDDRTSLSRSIGRASVNVDVPLSSRRSDFDPIGNFTLNGNAEVEHLSDFGSLTTLGAGANWSPVDRLNLIASWTREEGAPSVQQLGNPVLETPGSRVFDFTRGETVLATAVTGGNRDLLADRRSVTKLGVNWQPVEETDLRLRGEYVRMRFDDPVSSFPGATAELEAAFPDRFVRDAGGQLVRVDLRPVNYDSARRDTLRVGFDFTKPLKSAAPSPAQIEAFRARRQAAGQGAGQPSAGRRPARRRQARVRRRRRRWRRFFGGREGGRLTFSLTDTVTLVDEVTIRPGLPQARLSERRRGRPERRARAARDRGRGRLFQQRARRPPVGQLPDRQPGRQRGRRIPALLAAGDGRPQAIRQPRPALRPGRQASVAARQLGAARAQQPVRRQAQGAQRARRGAVQLPGRPARPDGADGRNLVPQAVPAAAPLLPPRRSRSPLGPHRGRAGCRAARRRCRPSPARG